MIILIVIQNQKYKVQNKLPLNNRILYVANMVN